MSEDGKPSIIVPGTSDNDANRIRAANARFKQVLEDNRPAGVGFIVIAFETPLSMRKTQVSLATDHDAETVDRILRGIIGRNKPRIIA